MGISVSPSMPAVMKALKKTGHIVIKTIFRFLKNRERTNIIETAAKKKSRLNSPATWDVICSIKYFLSRNIDPLISDFIFLMISRVNDLSFIFKVVKMSTSLPLDTTFESISFSSAVLPKSLMEKMVLSCLRLSKKELKVFSLNPVRIEAFLNICSIFFIRVSVINVLKFV